MKKQNEMIIIKDNKSQQIIDKYSNFDNKFVISKKEITIDVTKINKDFNYYVINTLIENSENELSILMNQKKKVK